MSRPKGMGERKGLYPAADPTAPGGMSQDELVSEMVTYHGWGKAEAKALTWTEQIEVVCQERLNREREKEKEMTTNPDKQPLFIGMPNSNDYIFDGHAGASPSGAERWMSCTASLAASRKFLETLSPNQQREFASGSSAARQGTTAHAAGEAGIRLMLGQISEAEYDNILLELSIDNEAGEAYDEDMAEHVTEHLDFIQQYHDAGHRIAVEQRVEAVIPVGEDDATYAILGSADAVSYPTPTEPVLTIIDYKHGEGKDVTVDENPQLRIYGLGVLGDLVDEDGNLPEDLETIEYVIVQPRSGGIKTFSESVDDLLDWRDDVLSPALTAALWGKGAEFNPSDEACQWCPAKGGCAALAKSRQDKAVDLFSVVQDAEYENGPGSFPETGLMSNDDLGDLYSQILGLTKLAEDMKAEVNRRLHRGETVPGFHLVNYQPPKFWAEDAATCLSVDTMEDEGARLSVVERDMLWKDPVLVTPTQALTLLKKAGLGNPEEELSDLIIQPEKRPVAAPVTDRRSAWTGVPPEQMFNEEEA